MNEDESKSEKENHGILTIKDSELLVTGLDSPGQSNLKMKQMNLKMKTDLLPLSSIT